MQQNVTFTYAIEVDNANNKNQNILHYFCDKVFIVNKFHFEFIANKIFRRLFDYVDIHF